MLEFREWCVVDFTYACLVILLVLRRRYTWRWLLETVVLLRWALRRILLALLVLQVVLIWVR